MNVVGFFFSGGVGGCEFMSVVAVGVVAAVVVVVVPLLLLMRGGINILF